MARDDLDRLSKRGDPVRHETFNEFRRELRRDRVSIAGVPSYQTSGGLVTMAGTGKAGLVMIKTNATLYARVDTSPGGGTGKIVHFNGSAMVEGDDVDLKNLSETSGASGKYGFAIKLDGFYFVVSLEC